MEDCPSVEDCPSLEDCPSVEDADGDDGDDAVVDSVTGAALVFLLVFLGFDISPDDELEAAVEAAEAVETVEAVWSFFFLKINNT